MNRSHVPRWSAALLLVLAAACSKAPTPEVQSAPATSSASSGTLIVALEPERAGDLDALLSEHALREVSRVPALALYTVAPSHGDLDAAIDALAADPRVKSVEVDHTRQANRQP